MDIRNGKAIKTLIRNKLLNNTIEDFLSWFHDKGVHVEKHENYFFLKNIIDMKSEITDFCNSIIFKGPELLCFHGPKIEKTTLNDLKDKKSFIWNEETVFLQYLEGKKCWMFWDKEEGKWKFSDENKPNSAYKRIIEKNIRNIMAMDPSFTYSFNVVENKGDLNGVYLETCHHTEECKELSWKETYDISIRAEVKHPDVYKFEGFEKLEESDFPVYVRDKSKSIYILERII